MTGRPKLLKPERVQTDRVQTGVRMDKRLVKTLKAVAELHDLSLGELLERLVHRAFAGLPPFEESTLAKVHELMGIYGLPSAVTDAPAPVGE